MHRVEHLGMMRRPRTPDEAPSSEPPIGHTTAIPSALCPSLPRLPPSLFDRNHFLSLCVDRTSYTQSRSAQCRSHWAAARATRRRGAAEMAAFRTEGGQNGAEKKRVSVERGHPRFSRFILNFHREKSAAHLVHQSRSRSPSTRGCTSRRRSCSRTRCGT